MSTKISRPLFLALFSLVLALGASSAYGQATITILNNDGAGEGFNDPAIVAPVGGNPGTTLGQQRLLAFQHAATIWGNTLTSSVTITIQAQFNPQTCTATSAVLGSAGAVFIHRDFAGAPFGGTWYNESLANKLFGSDLNASHEINATFNTNLGQTGCLDGRFFYLGFDNNHGNLIDLVSVLLHEFGHGLGFQTFTNGTTGAFNTGFPTIYDRFLVDNSTGESWIQMTNAERAASAIGINRLAWNGPTVEDGVPNVLGSPVVQINSPTPGSFPGGPAEFGARLTPTGVTGNVVQAIDPADGAGPLTTDGCTALTNAAAVAGNIAIIDRGTCAFTIKVKNAQDAGAIGVIIADNAPGPVIGMSGSDPTITIPAERVTQDDGNTIKTAIGLGTVNATLRVNPAIPAGADALGKALLFTPNPFSGGSSVSHWDVTMFPNQLMEPNISADLTHSVTLPEDLTFSQMTDIGWVATPLPSSITKVTGDNQNTALSQPFVVPFSVTTSPAVNGITVTWTVNFNGGGAGATFPSTGTRFATSTTNALGVATAPPLTANGTAGVYSMNATVPGAGTTTFSLANDPVPVAGGACFTDTTQADFQAGVTNNTDVITSPGNVILTNPATVDQQQTEASTSGTGFTPTQWLGQTFIPSVTGQLAKIDMALFCASCTGVDQPITVEIRTTTGSPALPTPTVLASTTIPGFSSGASSIFTASFASPPTLTSGTTYAYTLRLLTPRTGTYAAVFSLGPAAYANGNRVVSIDSGGTWTVPTSTGTARDLVFTTYMQTGNAPAGDFVSSLKDSNPPFLNTFWSTMSWTATVPANTTLRFQVAGSNNFAGPFNFVGPDSTAGTFFTTSPASITQFSGNRYLKYKAYLTTADGLVTPTVHDVTVCFNNPPTAAPATISGQIVTAEGSPLSGVTMRLTGHRSATTITDANGNYRFNNVDTDQFYTVTPTRANYSFNPGNRSFSLLANMSDAVFTAIPDAVAGGNAIDSSEYFVRQHYLDFLGREPDESGFGFWSDQIGSCGIDVGCRERKRINVSAAYFLSIEFQNTGGVVDGLYRASFGRRPLFAEFMPDTRTVAEGVIVGDGDWAGRLTANKRAFVDQFVTRAAFREAYDGLSNAAYVDQLIAHTGISYPQDARDGLVNQLATGAITRAGALLRIAENDGFASAKRNEAFVMMQYFGYLRRDPDENGYQFWLKKLRDFNGNFEQAQMVKAFIDSGEYRARFR